MSSSKKTNGIIPTLDEQCLISRATDDRYARELYKKCEGGDRFIVSNRMRVDHQFQIRHYAGDVVYSSAGIIEKKRDTLGQEGVDLLLGSISEMVQQIGEIEAVAPHKAKPQGMMRSASQTGLMRTLSKRNLRRGNGPQNRRTVIGAKSLGSQFKEDLNSLVSDVNTTHPHYVRCIKPNDDLKPNIFNNKRIEEQLRNAGVLEVVRVARTGFPVRLGIEEFIDRYGMVAVTAVEKAYLHTVKESQLDQQNYVCCELIKAILLQPTGHKPVDETFQHTCCTNGLQMGLTKVFFQQRAFNKVRGMPPSIDRSSVKISFTLTGC